MSGFIHFLLRKIIIKPLIIQQSSMSMLAYAPHTAFAEGLRSLIQSDPEFTVPAIASTGQEAITLTGCPRSDLVTMEITLPDITGMDLAGQAHP